MILFLPRCDSHTQNKGGETGLKLSGKRGIVGKKR